MEANDDDAVHGMTIPYMIYTYVICSYQMLLNYEICILTCAHTYAIRNYWSTGTEYDLRFELLARVGAWYWY